MLESEEQSFQDVPSGSGGDGLVLADEGFQGHPLDVLRSQVEGVSRLVGPVERD